MPPRKPKLRLVPAPTAPSVPTPKHDPYPHERAEIEALEPEHFKALVSISTMIQGLDLRYHRLPRQETEHYKALLDLGLIRADTQAYALSYIAPARVAMATLAIAFARDPKSVPMATLSPVSRLRAAVAGGDVRELGMLASSGDSILSVIGPAARPEWLAGMSAELRVSYLSAALRRESMELGPIAHLLEAAAQQREPMKALPELRLRTAIGLALRGEWVAALTVANGRLAKWGREAIELLVAYWSGEFAEALELGTRTIQAMTTARKDPSLADIAGICHILVAIVGAKQPEQLAEVDRLIEVTNLGGRPSVRESLMAIRWRLLGGADLRSRPVVAKWHRDSGDWLKVYVDLLHDAWLPQNDRKGPRPLVLATAELWRARAEAGGYPAIASEFAAIGDHVGPRESSGGLVSLFHPPTAWEAALASLEVAALQNTETAAAPRELLWQIDGDPPRWITIKARVRSGRATKGRSVPFDRLLDSEFADLLTDADRRVLASVTTSGYYRGVGPILALVGHPRVIDKHGASVQVERGRPTLRTIQANGSTTLELVPAELVDHDIVVSEPGPGRMVVYEQTREILQIVEALVRPGGFVVPDEGRGRLAQVLARLAALGAVEVEGDLAVTAETVDADARPVFQLGWNGGALAVRLRVVPLGAGGPTLMPGVGAERLVADVRRDGRTELRQCSRVLEQERGLATAALDACPTLSGFADGEWQWRASSIHVALEILLELDALGEAVVVAWQAGQKLDLPRVADLSDLRIKVKSGKAWFEVDANLQIDEFTVMQFRELLRNREGSRFVALPRGQFLALSDRLRQHLDKIESLGVPSGDGLRAAPAVLPMLEDLAAETIDADFDPAALARLSKLRKISERVPKLPRGFAAKLRDYQREGYEFLMRLAEAGFGACLADDMGLGKTIQALAVLTARSKSGPSLVVCPTSVVTNWINEAERFAPTLRFATLGDAPDRAALVAAAGPRDVIVTTYSLLANEIELLAKIEFSTAVFDEAHALKNAKTQRATAARSIVAEFRLALTGTPIENHLGELWSLFAVIVPGLLGNESNFEERFTNLRDDRERSLRLRALLRPFVLRRLKSQVLDELPPRTEITLRIEPNPEQRGWYEAMRREALARIQSMKQAKQRFQLLAEITKLRQAAIDPRLVDPEAPKGEKFGVLLDRIDELRAEGHRALVFTQFLASMAEIRNGLEERGIESFQIDGSTPARERARRIDAFQAGEADVFVLSLRAGGVGINLTGADYVFHIDPWWNPAVEDQASDRAHRIGQRRPVTIYRLVTAGTIEEKILELHANKRQLADDLLNGLETGEVLDLEQLRGLLGG